METIYSSKNLIIKAEFLGMLRNNVYLLESNNEKVIIDPSCDVDKIIALANGDDISKILLTHYHWDHTRACSDLKKITNASVYASKLDACYVENPEEAPLYRKNTPCNVDVKVNENDIIQIGNTSWKVIETPGHTMGCICFYCENCGNKPVLVCGDTLFKCSCGRVDFPDSSPSDMKKSLEKISHLPDDTIVLPGHEEITTIGFEKNFMLKPYC